MNSNLDIFSILKEACLVASKIQLEYYKKDFKVSHKELPADLVTEVDIKSQAAIIENLTKSMLDTGFKEEEIGFIGEEGVNTQAQHLFIIDPLDGTSNYVERNGQFCISIAYLTGGDLLAGVVYQPTGDVFCFAEKNKGAFQIENGIKTALQIKSIALADAAVAFNSSSASEVSERVFDAVSKLKFNVNKVQKTRSAILTGLSVTTNKNNVAINGKTKIWDIAALKLITEEAGGIITDWTGQELIFDLADTQKSYAIIVTQKGLLAEIIKLIK